MPPAEATRPTARETCRERLPTWAMGSEEASPATHSVAFLPNVWSILKLSPAGRGATWTGLRENGFSALTRFVERRGERARAVNGARGGLPSREVGGQPSHSASDGACGSGKRVARLEALPSWTWHTKQAAWDIGFSTLSAHVAREGTSRVRAGPCRGRVQTRPVGSCATHGQRDRTALRCSRRSPSSPSWLDSGTRWTLPGRKASLNCPDTSNATAIRPAFPQLSATTASGWGPGWLRGVRAASTRSAFPPRGSNVSKPFPVGRGTPSTLPGRTGSTTLRGTSRARATPAFLSSTARMATASGSGWPCSA